MKYHIVLGTLLIAESRRASIGRLVDAVWGTTPPSTADKQIRNAVSSLRTVLATSGAAITSVAEGYQLDIGAAEFDLHCFHRHVARAQRHLDDHRHFDAIAEFRAALSSWTGPMLAGLESSDQDGLVEVLVANAGITKDQLLFRMSEEDFAAVLDTNLTGTFRVVKRAAGAMLRARTGRVVLMSSMVGLRGAAGQANYAVSKACLIGFVRSFAREMGPRGVTCNVIAASWTPT